MFVIIKQFVSRPCCYKYCPDAVVRNSLPRLNQWFMNSTTSESQFREFYLLSNSCIFNSTQRVLATPDNYHVPIEKSNELNYFWEDYTNKVSFKRRCVNTVCSILNCTEKEANDWTSEHPLLFLEDIDNSVANIKLLISNGVSSDKIKNNIWLLYYENDDLNFRINTVIKWNISDCNLTDFLNLLKLSPYDFKKVSDIFALEKDTVPRGNRILYLAELLHVSVEELTARLVRHKYLLVRNIDLIVAAIKSYLDFGINERELVDDIWALRYTEPVIRKRLQILKDVNFPSLKPWYVRCSEENFEKMMEAHKLEKSMMHPFKTRVEFLAHLLEIKLPVMAHVIEKNRVFKKIHIVKLIEMIDYLKRTGFKGTEICSNARIFYFSYETILQRVNELKHFGVEPLCITVLMKNHSEYQKFIDRMEYVNSLRLKRNQCE